MKKIIGVIIWVVGGLLIFSMATSNDNRIETIDLSGLKTANLVIGTNDYLEPTFRTSAAGFFGPSYDLVLVGISKRKIVYQGRNENGWYQAERPIFLGFTQKIREIRLENRKLIFVCNKDVGGTIFVSIMIIVFFGAIGKLFFSFLS